MVTAAGSRTLTMPEIAFLAKSAGFAPGDVAIATAIAIAESGGQTGAHNTNAATGDNSYGLWQINMLGALAAPRRIAFGITSNEQLFDPAVNARAALVVRRTQGWTAWSAYGNPAFRAALPGATQAANAPVAPSSDGFTALPNPADILSPLNVVQTILNLVFTWLKEQFLRVAMFVGGMFLAWLGIQMFMASSVTPVVLDALGAVKGTVNKAKRVAS